MAQTMPTPMAKGNQTGGQTDGDTFDHTDDNQPGGNTASKGTGDIDTLDDRNGNLADTCAQRTLALVLGRLLSIGAGLTAWWVSQHKQSRH